jgi:hypothetical protein
MIGRCWPAGRRRLRHVMTAGLVAAGAFETARAQDTTTSERAYVLEGRLGGTAAVGAKTRRYLTDDAAVGVTLAFEISERWWGWASADYKPWNWSGFGESPPAINMYALTAGVSRRIGLPFVSRRRKPFELGLGVGATQVQMHSQSLGGEGAPPGAQLDDVASSGLLGSVRWRPTAAARLRLAVPIWALRVSATAALHATYVGDVPLWDGGWEPTGEGSRYRPSARVWSFGTVLTAPVTLGLGFSF